MNAEQTGAGAEESAAAALTTEVDQLAESSQPSKKETSLREFLGKMDEYAPIVSESLRLSLSLFLYIASSCLRHLHFYSPRLGEESDNRKHCSRDSGSYHGRRETKAN